jgi:hypothetical protein
MSRISTRLDRETIERSTARAWSHDVCLFTVASEAALHGFADNLQSVEYRHMKSDFIENVGKRRKRLFQTTHFTAEELSPADLDLVILLNNKCIDFFLFQNGQPPSEADAREVFESVAPPCPGATKLPIGIFDQFGKLVGLTDVLRGYRTASDWYIGLMLLAPAFQGQRFSTQAVW